MCVFAHIHPYIDFHGYFTYYLVAVLCFIGSVYYTIDWQGGTALPPYSVVILCLGQGYLSELLTFIVTKLIYDFIFRCRAQDRVFLFCHTITSSNLTLTLPRLNSDTVYFLSICFQFRSLLLSNYWSSNHFFSNNF